MRHADLRHLAGEELQSGQEAGNRYPKAFRLMALERMKSCDNISELARELNVDRSVLYHWRDQLGGDGDGTTIKSPMRELRREIRDLKRCWRRRPWKRIFRGALQKVEARRRSSTGSGEMASTSNPRSDANARQPESRADVRVGTRQPCWLLSVVLQEPAAVEESMEVRSAIQQIALQHKRRYGYRRVTAELKRRGMVVNRKRVARIMREDNLLAVQPKRFVTPLTPKHALEVYLNLARRMHLTAKDQIWIADITYIRLQNEFVYLALVLDGFSRKVVGWKLDRTLASRLAMDALESAIAARKPLPG